MINFYLDSLKGIGEDLSTHFFGSPLLTKKLAKTKFHKEEMFLCQLNFEELAPFDKEGLLPKQGVLYVFFDVFTRKHTLFYAKSVDDVELVFLDDFNAHFDNKRYNHPMKVDFSVPSTDEEKGEYCHKLLCPIPESVKDQIYRSDDYVCLMLCVPELMYDQGRDYLMKLKECSCIVIKKKHLLKGKFHKAITLNY